MQIVLNIISVLAFVMSLSTWIHSFITQGKKINFTVERYFFNKQTLVIRSFIENKSRLPISISRIQIRYDKDISYSCETLPKKIYTTTLREGGRIVSSKDYYAASFPLSIPSLGATCEYLLFEQCNLPENATGLNFVIYTNRGKPLQISTSLPPASPDEGGIPIQLFPM